MQKKLSQACPGTDLTQEKEDWVKEFDKKFVHYLWTILVSLITAILTNVLLGKL